MSDLYRPRFLPDLLIAALDRSGDRPCLFIDGDVITAAQMRDQISCYVQAFAAQGIAPGKGIATLSKNRPEVLRSMGAIMVGGYRTTPLHPLGSLEDHAYVLEDAAIETLIFDPVFAERADQLRQRVPALNRLLSYGDADVGENLVSIADTFEPQPLVGPHVDPEDLSALSYTGGTTGRPKGVMNTYRGSAAMAQIMVSEWQWPDEVRHLVCTPLSHAGSALFVPLLLRGGSMVVVPGFEAGAVLEAIERHRITTTMLVPSMPCSTTPALPRPTSPACKPSSTGRLPFHRRDSGRRSANSAPSSSSSTARRSALSRSVSFVRRSTIPMTSTDWRRVAGRCHGFVWDCSTTTVTK
jgi:fatty-acyl-CoA synthase